MDNCSASISTGWSKCQKGKRAVDQKWRPEGSKNNKNINSCRKSAYILVVRAIIGKGGRAKEEKWSIKGNPWRSKS